MEERPQNKLKLLEIQDLLLRETDDEHHLTVQEIIDYLAAKGMKSERKSIYLYMELLEAYGMDIINDKEKQNRYHVGNRLFQLAELKLLVDAVKFAKFITAEKSSELITKLKSLTSVHEAERLERNDWIYNRLKSKNNAVYLNVDAIHEAILKQRMIRFKYFDYDLDKEIVYLMLFKVYRGTLAGKEEYQFPSSEDFLEEFVVQYYSENEPPEELIAPEPFDDSLEEFLAHLKGKKVRVTVPKQGEKKELLLLAQKNLEISVFGDRAKLVALQEALHLPKKPEVIECFDISHLAGSFAVGSMVQFRSGKPDKSNYRRFKIRDVQGGDDFASIAEVVRRRYSRLKEENKELPDLIVIDGGAGQLSSALKELREMRVKVPIISLAKREEEIYVPGLEGPLDIKKNEKASLYLQEIRDEAHRFAIAYNRLLRKKALTE